VKPFETSSVSISEAIRFVEELLDPGAFEVYGPNGLLVAGGASYDIVGEFVAIPNPVQAPI
jgi:hypothetical protein